MPQPREAGRLPAGAADAELESAISLAVLAIESGGLMKMTTYEYFLKAEQIETIAAEIYEQLAGRFLRVPEIAADFRELACEEVQHALRVRMIGAQHRSNARLFAHVERLDEELNEVYQDALLVRAEARSGCWGEALSEIHPRLVAMEEHFALLHGIRMARGADPAIARFFESLSAQDRAHERLLRIRRRAEDGCTSFLKLGPPAVNREQRDRGNRSRLLALSAHSVARGEGGAPLPGSG